MDNVNIGKVNNWTIVDKPKKKKALPAKKEKQRPPLNINNLIHDVQCTLDRLKLIYDMYPMKDLYDGIISLEASYNSLLKLVVLEGG